MSLYIVQEECASNENVREGIKDHKNLSSRSRLSGTTQVVEFIIGEELFAVDLFDTREVINTPDITPVPNSPSFVTGMIDLRGVITTIIDLRAIMHISKEAAGKKRARVIVLDKAVSEKMIGILVDDVYSVTTYAEEDIDQGIHSSHESHRDILGVIRKHRKDERSKEKRTLVIWLDIRTMVRRVEREL